MEYRVMPRGGEKVSIIGMGTSVIGEGTREEAVATIRAAYENGINYFDMAGGHASNFEAAGEALDGIRDKVYLQVHFGADYTTGEYGWTTSLERIQKSVKWQLEKLRTDYIDFGMIHCIDEKSDLEAYIKNGVLDCISDLKRKGVVKHIGLSSHTPSLVNKLLDMNIVDVVMFSINPVYDYGRGEFGFGENAERRELYARCLREGVAITVMKPYCGGQLLDAAKSPFGIALTAKQCLAYALDEPAVVTVLPGFGNRKELFETLEYLNSTEAEKDYSAISGFDSEDAKDSCVYCRHCHPCPVGIDIALVNKYYDLSVLGDKLAHDHYLTLDKRAGDCIGCGHCDSRCPFGVKQSGRMEEIKNYFGC